MEVPEYLRRAMEAHGVDPDEAAAAAAELDLDALESAAVEEATPSATEPAAEQLPLSDPDADQLGKFQAGDHETQRLAALRAYPATGTARRLVLDEIGGSLNGLTDEEIQESLHMNPSTQRPRRVELVEGGWIEDSTRRRLTSTKREAVVWVLTEAGRQQWQPRRGSTWEPGAA